MKKQRLLSPWLFLAAVFLLCAGAGAFRAQAAGTVTYKVRGTIDYEKSFECLSYINKLRKSKGLSALKMSKTMLAYAEQRGAELTCAYTHTRPNGKSPASLSSSWIHGENIALGQPTAEDAFDSWRNSPPHYKNMTTAAYRTAGIVCYEYGGMYCWVNLFSRRSAASYKKTGEKTVTKKVTVATKYLKKKNLYSLTYAAYLGRNAQIRLSLSGFPNQLFDGRIGNTLFKYSSSDPSVLKVDNSGTLLPQQVGTAKITVWAKANKKCKKTFTITVMEEEDAYMDPDYSDD